MTGRLIEAARRSRRRVHVDGVWVSVRAAGPEPPRQGWKLHVSARPGSLAETIGRVLPLLLEQDVAFKVARSPGVLRELNSGDGDPAVVGKAITVYPPPDVVVELGRRLAEALAGLAGPRVPSDRRVRPDAPVYYRYGPFQPQYRIDDNGQFELVVIGPHGETWPGAAGLEYSCPPWASDPFRPVGLNRAAVPAGPGVRTLGGRYRLTSRVARGRHGNVYRATDPGGRTLVIKEARAYIGENQQGSDLRRYLRNERRVLLALAGVPSVPELVDHFRHGEDEYLAMSDAGARNLHHFVGERGLFRDEPAGTGRDLRALAARLLEVLDQAHARGVIVRDLSPKNVALGEDGGCTLIDFGTSAHGGVQLPGWTPGYSVPDQRTDRPAEPADDYFSLGATLYFAATGLNPVATGDDPGDWAGDIERTLSSLNRVHPGPVAGVCSVLPGLLSLDPAQRRAAVDDLRAGRLQGADAAARNALPRGPRLSPDLLDQIVGHIAGECAGFARRLLEKTEGAGGWRDSSRRSPPPLTNVYAGSAGLGLELVHHPGTGDLVAGLARWTQDVRLPPTHLVGPLRFPASLHVGRTGTAIFLAAARGAGVPGLAPVQAVELAADEGGDYLHGLAGIGTGHLILHGLESAAGHLATAAECARRLLAGDVTMPKRAIAAAPAGSGIALETGFAHGRAGVAAFLLAYHRATGDPAAGDAAAARFAELASEAEELITILAGPDARPMGVSWCQGMAGIVTALVPAAEAYGGRYLDLARDGARSCLALAPRCWVVSQCCGLAGIGDTLIDVALATGEEEFWQAAAEITELILIRSGGAPAHPKLPGESGVESASWAMGAPGVLSFLRRLRQRSGARLWTAQWTPPGL